MKIGLKMKKYNKKVINMLKINNLIKINQKNINSKKKYHVYIFKKTHHKQNLLCVYKK